MKTTHHLTGLLLGVILITTGCSKNSKEEINPSIVSDNVLTQNKDVARDAMIIQEVKKVIQEHIQLMFEGNALKTAEAYASDGTLTVGGIGVISGFESLQGFYTGFFSGYKTVSLVYNEGIWNVSKDGKVVILSTTIQLSLENKATNQTVNLLIDVTSVLEKQKNKWLVLAEQNSLRVPLL